MAGTKSRTASKTRRSTAAAPSSSSASETTSTAVTDAATLQHHREALPSIEERFAFAITQLHICQSAVEKVLYGDSASSTPLPSSSTFGGASAVPFVSSASIARYQSGAPVISAPTLQYMSYPYPFMQAAHTGSNNNGNTFSTDAILNAVVTGQHQQQQSQGNASASSAIVVENPLLFPPAVTGEPLHVLLARKVRALLPELRQSTDAARHHVVKTPREVLNELVGCLRSVLLSAFHPSMKMGGSADSETKENLFAVYVSTRTVPIEVIVQGLFLTSYVSVKVRLELLQAQLQAKLDSELESKRRQIDEFDRRAKEDKGEDRTERKLARDALVAQLMKLETTGVLRSDLKRIFDNILLTFSACCESVGEESLLNASSASPAVPSLQSNANLSEMVRVLTMLYYQLGDWMLMAERADEMTSVPSSSASSAANVRITSVDEEEGIIRLRRESTACSWGIFLNESGELIGIDTGLRFTSGKNGSTVHELLRRSGGLRVLAVNNVSLTDLAANTQKHNHVSNNDNAAQTTSNSSGVTNNLMAAIGSEAQKRTSLVLHVDITGENSVTTAAGGTASPVNSHSNNRKSKKSKGIIGSRSDVKELSFWVHNQGGEGATGQRATLVLHRMDENTPWGLTVDRELFFIPEESDQVPSSAGKSKKKVSHKKEVSFQTALSGASLAFFATHRSRVKMFAVNGVLVQGPQQVVELSRNVDTIQVEFILMDAPVVPESPAEKKIKDNTNNKKNSSKTAVADQTAKPLSKKVTPTPVPATSKTSSAKKTEKAVKAKETSKAAAESIPPVAAISPPMSPRENKKAKSVSLKETPLVQSTAAASVRGKKVEEENESIVGTIKPTGDSEIDKFIAEYLEAKPKKKVSASTTKATTTVITSASETTSNTNTSNSNSSSKGQKKSVAEEIDEMNEVNNSNKKEKKLKNAPTSKDASESIEKPQDASHKDDDMKVFHDAMEELNDKIEEAADEVEVEKLIAAAKELQSEIEGLDEADEAEAKALAGLSSKEPVKFANGVVLESIADSTLVFTRPSLNQGWGFRLAVIPTTTRWSKVHLQEFPSFDPKSAPPPKTHPIHQFIAGVNKFPRIESVSGVNASKGSEMVEVMRRALRIAIKMRLK